MVGGYSDRCGGAPELMPILLLALLLAVVAYLWWQWRTTTLTRECRWRQHKTTGDWRCSYCGAVTDQGPPKLCLRKAQQ